MCAARPRQRWGHEETHGAVSVREQWIWAQQDTRANKPFKTQVSRVVGDCAFAGQGGSLKTLRIQRRQKVKNAGHETVLAAK